jgi:transcriptional regulator with GAF, ATPase, and Fis domain
MMAFEDLPALLERVLDRLSSIVKPDRAAILLVDPETGALIPRAVRPAGAYSSVSEFASSTVVHQALTARDVFIVHDIRMDPRLQQAASVMLAGVRSVICVPLLGRSGPIGALYADKLGVEQFAPELPIRGRVCGPCGSGAGNSAVMRRRERPRHAGGIRQSDRRATRYRGAFGRVTA